MNTHYFGYIPDPPDERDFIFRAVQKVEQIPPSMDLREYCSPVRDQGQLGSCTAFAMGSGLREFMQNRVSPAPPPKPGCLAQLMNRILPKYTTSEVSLSPLFLYYEERALNGNIYEDSGASMRDGMKVLNKLGCCSEVDWPYIIGKYTVEPEEHDYMGALDYRITVYSRLATLTDIKSALAVGNGVVFGFAVFESFQSITDTGYMLMPEYGEQLLGWHAVFVCGYKDDALWPGGGYLIVKNSWGDDWGNRGYFYMPYDYVSIDKVVDIWTASV